MSVWQTIRFSARTGHLGQLARSDPRWIEWFQRRRLRRLVRFAAAHSPFYAEKFSKVDLRQFQLSDLPTTTKSDLRQNFDRAVTDPRVRLIDVEQFVADANNLGKWYLGRYALSHTSGSQGQPLPIVQDRRSLEILFSLMSSRANAVGPPNLREGIRKLRTPVRVAVVSARRAFFPSAAAFEFMSEIVGPYVQLQWLSSMQPDLIERLNEFQPHTLVGYASVLEALALQSQRLHLTELRQVANSSEQLSDRAHERIRAAFNVPAMDHYGTGECLLLADGCPTHGGAHVNADWAILEIVDEHNRSVPPGVVGAKVLVTNLANRVQPFIRYEVGDRVAWADEKCDCGSRLPRIARIEGRAAEIFWIEAGDDFRIISGVLFHSAADSLRVVREWQAVQHERNRITLRIELFRGATLSAEGVEILLQAKLRELGLPHEAHVTIQLVEALRADATTGKFRRMISEVGIPAPLQQQTAAGPDFMSPAPISQASA